MAVLINGNGNEAIYAQQDADWFASIMGNQTAITGIGNKFAASLLDANTIGVSDGVIITQEGRRIQLDVNEIDSFDIPAGGQGETNYYIIGYHLVTGDLSEQYCETFVRLMDNDTDTIPEDTFRGGADEVFVSLYRVTQDDLVITDMDLLLPEITNLSRLNSNLTANQNPFRFGYDSVNQQYGYIINEGGADTLYPFSKKPHYIFLWTKYDPNASSTTICAEYDVDNGTCKQLFVDNIPGSTVNNSYLQISAPAWNQKILTAKKPCKYYHAGVEGSLNAGDTLSNLQGDTWYNTVFVFE